MYWWGIPLALIVSALLGGVSGNRSQAGTSLIMLVNWAMCTAVVLLTHDDYPILFFIVADYLSAITLFGIRTSHWQSAIMAVYGCQLLCHAAYALSNMGSAPTYYSYWAVTYMAWIQVALIAGWIGTEYVGRWIGVHRRSLGLETRTDADFAREKNS